MWLTGALKKRYPRGVKEGAMGRSAKQKNISDLNDARENFTFQEEISTSDEKETTVG